MPSWSVPPGLMVPGPRHPEANAQPPGPAPQPPGPAPQPPGSAPQPDAEEPASGDSSWPGVAPPAGWFLRAASPPVARQESASARESEGDQPAQPFASPAPGSGTPGLRDEAPAEPEPSAPAAPTSLWPGAIAWPSASPSPGASPSPNAGASPNASGGPSPTREPDGSWPSPLTPKPARRRLGPTQARYGRAGGPGFQPTRSGQPGPEGASTDDPRLSPWQRSHRLWTEAGIEWERRPAPQLPYQRQASPVRPPVPPRHAQGQQIRSAAAESPAPARQSAAAAWPARRRRRRARQRQGNSRPHRNGRALMTPRAGPGGCRSPRARRVLRPRRRRS